MGRAREKHIAHDTVHNEIVTTIRADGPSKFGVWTNNGFLTRQGAGGVGDHVLLGGRVRVFG